MLKKLCNFIFCIFIFTQTSFSFANSKKLSCAVISNNLVGEQSDRDFSSIKYSVDQILSQRKDLKIIDRSKVDKILQEQAFQQSDWSDSNKSAEIGHALNANILIFVEYYRDFFVVNFLDVNTFEKTTVKSVLGKKNIYTRIKNVKINNHSILYNFAYWISCHRIFCICILVICGVFSMIMLIYTAAGNCHLLGVSEYIDESDQFEYQKEYEKEDYRRLCIKGPILFASAWLDWAEHKMDDLLLLPIFEFIAIVISIIIILLNNLSYALIFLIPLVILVLILNCILIVLAEAVSKRKISIPAFLSPDAFMDKLRKRNKQDRRIKYQRKKSSEETSEN